MAGMRNASSVATPVTWGALSTYEKRSAKTTLGKPGEALEPDNKTKRRCAYEHDALGTIPRND